jgi:hypothetical protein
MRRLATAPALLLLTCCWLLMASTRHTPDAAIPVTVYDSDPAHLWNRLYSALLVREDQHGLRFGEDSLDPLLWMESEHLLSQPSHQQVISILDEFLRQHGETQIHDPVKRAMLQRDLWSVFDWSVQQESRGGRPRYENEKRELQSRLAAVLRRLALSPEEIKNLPDNYAQAVASGTFAKEFDPAHPLQTFLPPDLFDPHGPWVGITPSPESDSGVAKMHIFSFSGRSGFLVFVRLPGGHKATLDYFQTLWNFPQPYVGGPNFASDQSRVNPDLPSFPAGTQVALIRRMNLFDNRGELTASNITESVQIRVYHTITNAEERFFNGGPTSIVKQSGQYFYQIDLSRPLLFSGKNGGLRAVGREEKELSTFQTKGNDPIEQPSDHPEFESNAIPRLQTCAWCHLGGGVRSLNSRESLLRPNRMQLEEHNSDYGSIYWGDSSAVEWKRGRYDWGLLNGYWESASVAHSTY